LTRHHRRPRRHKGKTEPRNISAVRRKDHEAWHLLFNHQEPEVIAKMINDVWLDPDYKFVVLPRHKVRGRNSLAYRHHDKKRERGHAMI
jgi:hypothetical protein